jgi:predicted nucleic acid-binding Zn ribbon protein
MTGAAIRARQAICVRCGNPASSSKNPAWRVPSAFIELNLSEGNPDFSSCGSGVEELGRWDCDGPDDGGALSFVACARRGGDQWWCETCATRALNIRTKAVASNVGLPALELRLSFSSDLSWVTLSANGKGSCPGGFGYVPMASSVDKRWRLSDLMESEDYLAGEWIKCGQIPLWPHYHAVRFTDPAPCAGCGTPVVLPDSRKRKGHYCSEKCRKATGDKSNTTGHCVWCETPLQGRRRRYCSDRCEDAFYNHNRRKPRTIHIAG